eukprot:1160266-Pelagomonas_calceolata.AAC.9
MCQSARVQKARRAGARKEKINYVGRGTPPYINLGEGRNKEESKESRNLRSGTLEVAANFGLRVFFRSCGTP